jgi:hypothetical protein
VSSVWRRGPERWGGPPSDVPPSAVVQRRLPKAVARGYEHLAERAGLAVVVGAVDAPQHRRDRSAHRDHRGAPLMGTSIPGLSPVETPRPVETARSVAAAPSGRVEWTAACRPPWWGWVATWVMPVDRSHATGFAVSTTLGSGSGCRNDSARGSAACACGDMTIATWATSS